MKRILEHIEQKKRELAASPFLRFISDTNIDPLERFAFVPCIAPFAMAYTDINKFILRDDSSAEPLQQVINTHSREEDSHWLMYLKDLRTLELTAPMELTSMLKLLWGNDCMRTRQMVYELTSLFIQNPDLKMRLMLVEAVEGTADVAFGFFSQAARELEERTGKKLHYFGMTHELLEANHSLGAESEEQKLLALEISPEQEEFALAGVDRVYELFGMMFDELLEYALRAGARQRLRAPAGSWQEPVEQAMDSVA
ncbi:MAG TPA: hypothetical protein VGB96_04250 [Archangium sp.]|jgi:hypothetical protein